MKVCRFPAVVLKADRGLARATRAFRGLPVGLVPARLQAAGGRGDATVMAPPWRRD